MQTNFKVLAFAAALLTGTTIAPALANDAEPASPVTSFTVNTYHPANSTNLRVFVQKHSTEQVMIELKNKEGVTLYEGVIGKREPGKALSFDLRDLPDGAYTVQVSSKAGKVVKDFNLSTPNRTLAVN